ncbi:MAG: beta-ketoacyl-ACP synthase III, partial [Shimia sp.]
MHQPAITGHGVFTPDQVITNDELVEAFNAYADRWNATNADAIAAGEVEAKAHSSSAFIEAASGIENRYVVDKSGILDPDVMHPVFPPRPDEAPSLMAEMGVDAARTALTMAGVDAGEVDLVLCAASNHERAYPAIAVEIQQLLGAGGFAYDMNVACSSATFGLQTAADMVRTGSVRKALVLCPEICSAHLEWRDRDCHFIFGDVATALLVERAEESDGQKFVVNSTRCATQFSNNIRNNAGYLR